MLKKKREKKKRKKGEKTSMKAAWTDGLSLADRRGREGERGEGREEKKSFSYF